VQLILGSFFPGKAFTDRDNAYFGEVIVTYWF
jgi:hypothetical protein